MKITMLKQDFLEVYQLRQLGVSWTKLIIKAGLQDYGRTTAIKYLKLCIELHEVRHESTDYLLKFLPVGFRSMELVSRVASTNMVDCWLVTLPHSEYKARLLEQGIVEVSGSTMMQCTNLYLGCCRIVEGVDVGDSTRSLFLDGKPSPLHTHYLGYYPVGSWVRSKCK